MKKCEEKTPFDTERQAILARIDFGHIFKCRYWQYQCSRCKKWHLTTHEPIWANPVMVRVQEKHSIESKGVNKSLHAIK